MNVVARRTLPGRSGATPLTFAVLFAAAAVVLFGMSPTLNPIDIVTGHLFDVSVPDVGGLTQVKALVKIQEAELHGTVEFAFSSTVERGYTIRQRPAAASTMPRDGNVIVVVSRGVRISTLPNLVGADERTAQKTLEALDLDVTIERVNDELVAAKTVASQSPAPGTQVLGGTSVNLTVSLGPVKRPVPEVSGLAVEGAAFLLGKSGFTLGTVTPTDNPTLPKDAVVGTDPPVGTVADRDTVINLLVSAGPAPVGVPDVTGRQQSDAATRLTAAGFVVGELTQLGPVGDPSDGKVLAQLPSAGTKLRPGSVVTLTVRRAERPPPATTIPLPPPTLPATTTTTTTTQPTTTTTSTVPSTTTTTRPAP